MQPEQCEYDPEAKRARYEGEGCTREAVLVVGTRGKWHLCGECAALPEFKRLTKRHPIRRPAAMVAAAEVKGG